MMIPLLYSAISYALWPALRVLPYLRARHGKEITARVCERFGQTPLPRPEGKLIWFHAASNGEALSALPLIDYFLSLPDAPHILVTTMTVTAERLVAARTAELPVIHQFIPYDHPQWIRRFHAHWHPDMAIWVESELWPNHLNALKAAGIPSVLANARLSDKSVKGWYRAREWFCSLLDTFDIVLAQTPRDRDNLLSLGIARAQCVGNLKDLALPLPYDPYALKDLQDCIGNRPVVLFASTHAPEEDMAKDIHLDLQKEFPDLLSIIVPRHPKRGEDIAKALNAGGLTVACRSLKMSPRTDTDIYIADTLGEMGVFYRLCPIVFVGNSMGTKPGGGHNLLEPAWFGCALLSGSDLHNFSEQAADMPAINALKICNDKNELYENIKLLLEDNSLADTMAAKASHYVAEKQTYGMDAVIAAIKMPCQKAGILQG